MEATSLEIPGYRLVAPVFADAAGADGSRPRVWRAVRLADSAPVAIKLFDARDADQAEREAAIGRELGHPHILAAREVVGADAAVALVLPWAAGGSLAALIACRRRLPWAETLTVLIPLADALAVAHERGYVHGDVSADNVLFDDDGRPLLADFGASRAAQEAGMPVAATPADVAPEIVRGAPASAASDLFSLGSVALRCLSGAPAWPADDLEDVLAQSTVGQWPDVDDRLAPAEFCAIVRRLLAPEPTDRGSAGRLAVELRGVGDPEPVGLVRTGDDGVLRGPAASTVLRPDAVRPPFVRGAAAVRHRRTRVRGRLSLPGWRGVLLAAAVLALLAGAVRLGTWWSGQGAARPVVAGTTAEIPATDARAADLPTDLTRDPAVGSAGMPRSDVADDAGPDWYAVVGALDAARTAAFVAGDASALDAVYTDAAPARDEDAERIAALTAARQHVTAAGHLIRSASLIDSTPDGEATVEVLESLPAYPVYAVDGSLVGYTNPVEAASVLLHLQPSGDGYRIRGIGAPRR